jgi:Putative peptidoglycan binding domain
MKQSVTDYWIEFNEPLEGRVNYMYCDMKGLVSTGVGNLIDATKQPMTAPSTAERSASLNLARQFRWTVAGNPASSDDVANDWDAVKARMDLATSGHLAYKPLTQLRLTDDEINRMIFVRFAEMETILKSRSEFSDFDNWPADAQLALMSMSWGMGPKFKFPVFQGFVADGDWANSATECRFQPDVGTIKIRNILDAQSFVNAARVVDEGHDPEQLVIDLTNVLGIQIALQHFGFNPNLKPGFTDGANGPRTKAAVIQYQEDSGLDPTGDPSDIALNLAVQLAGEGFFDALTN